MQQFFVFFKNEKQKINYCLKCVKWGIIRIGGNMMKRKSKIKSLFIAIISTGLLIGIVYYLYITYENIEITNDNYIADKISVSTKYGQTMEMEEEKNKNVADIIENVTKSVCGISKLKTNESSILSMATETELGLGTGIVVSENGYILSNSHVTGEKYSTCYVTIEDRNTYKGTVVWSDTELDVSLTKIVANDLKCAILGSSSEVRVGEIVYAIGNPIGYEFRRTVTSGIISAINRTIKIEENGKNLYMSNLIQTDATINPGNSGGPLIYGNGKVIGINSVKITSAEGIGFAIPIDVVKPVIESFIQKGEFNEATLGIYVYDKCVAQSLKIDTNFSSGIYIAQIIPGSSSDGSGLKIGDIINKIDGIEVNTINDLREYIYTKTPGDQVDLSITRNKKERQVTIILKKK